MTIRHFNLNAADPSWRPCIQEALQLLDTAYLEELYVDQNWLPGAEKIFNAFSIPVDEVQYVLFGESPYPRPDSANGFAFWDSSVVKLWSETGLSKEVNRATSLRNLIKMLLVAKGLLQPANTSQADIMNLDKQDLIQTNSELFQNLLNHGFLLLNATPVLRAGLVRKDALAWQPFIRHIVNFLLDKKPEVHLILLGNIAKTIDKIFNESVIKRIYAEHPYNITFINNPDVLAFFGPLQLLSPSKHAKFR